MIDGFKVFLVWMSQYDFYSKDIKLDDPKISVIKLRLKKTKKVLKLEMSNAHALLFLRIWTIIQDGRDF